jgi:hypothetical protein
VKVRAITTLVRGHAKTIQELVVHGAKVYMVYQALPSFTQPYTLVQGARSRSRANEAIQSITKDTGKSPIFLELDLADLASVQKAAQTFLESVRPSRSEKTYR